LRGELAKTIFDQLSPDVKRRFLLVVAGKHWGTFSGNIAGKKNPENDETWELIPILCFFFDDPQSFPSFLPSRARSMATMTTGFVVVPGVEMLATTLALDKCSDLTAAHHQG